MCQRREHRDVYQPIQELDAELGKTIRDVILDSPGGTWAGGYAYYAMTANV